MDTVMQLRVRVLRYTSAVAVAMTLFVLGCGSHKEIIGKWYAVSVGGKAVSSAEAQSVGFDFQEGGRFTGAAKSSGTWTVSGSTITLHKEKISGLTRDEYIAYFDKKTKSDPVKMAQVRQYWEDGKLDVGSDNKTLTIHRDSFDTVLQKRNE